VPEASKELFTDGMHFVGVTLDTSRLQIGAASGFFWSLWRCGEAAHAELRLREWVARSRQIDAVLLAQLTMHFDWRKAEHFLELQTMKLLCWGSLASREVAWEYWV